LSSRIASVSFIIDVSELCGVWHECCETAVSSYAQQNTTIHKQQTIKLSQTAKTGVRQGWTQHPLSEGYGLVLTAFAARRVDKAVSGRNTSSQGQSSVSNVTII